MPFSLDSPPLDPSSGEGRRLLADELSRPEYSPQDNPLRRAVQSVIDRFLDLLDAASGGPLSAWWYAVVAAVVLTALAAAAWAVLRLEPARRARRSGSGGVFEEQGITAAEYRRRALAAREAGDMSTAVLDGFRAIAAAAVEAFVLDDRPGATAREISRSLANDFPSERDALDAAAGAFDAVRYGGRTASGADADALLELDRRLEGRAPVSVAESPAVAR